MAYYGRNGGLAVSGADVVRPSGIYPTNDGERARLRPTQKLDFEIELAFFISGSIPKGTIVSAKDAAEHIFGFVLLNDWSARDIQKHEMAPLGVFHSKSFQTSISPWIVTLDALKGSPAGPPQSNETDIESLLKCDAQDHGVFDLDFSAKVSRKQNNRTLFVCFTNY
jgi:fumarylacetoacetase